MYIRSRFIIITFWAIGVIHAGVTQYDLSRFERDSGTQYIHLLGDVHNLGTPEQVQEQLEAIDSLVKDKIVSEIDKPVIFIERYTKICRENPFYYMELLARFKDVYELLDGEIKAEVIDSEVRHLSLLVTDFMYLCNLEYPTRDGKEINTQKITLGDIFDDYQALKNSYFESLVRIADQNKSTGDAIAKVGNDLLKEIMEKFDAFMEIIDEVFDKGESYESIRAEPLNAFHEKIVNRFPNLTGNQRWRTTKNKYLLECFNRINVYSRLLLDFNFFLNVLESRNRHVFIIAGKAHTDKVKEAFRKLDAQIICHAHRLCLQLEKIDSDFLYLRRILRLLWKRMQDGGYSSKMYRYCLLDIEKIRKELNKAILNSYKKNLNQYEDSDNPIAGIIESSLEYLLY